MPNSFANDAREGARCFDEHLSKAQQSADCGWTVYIQGVDRV